MFVEHNLLKKIMSRDISDGEGYGGLKDLIN
jgi:hypothetical protein